MTDEELLQYIDKHGQQLIAESGLTNEDEIIRYIQKMPKWKLLQMFEEVDFHPNGAKVVAKRLAKINAN